MVMACIAQIYVQKQQSAAYSMAETVQLEAPATVKLHSVLNNESIASLKNESSVWTNIWARIWDDGSKQGSRNELEQHIQDTPSTQQKRYGTVGAGKT